MARVRGTGRLTVSGMRQALRLLRQVNRDRAQQIINASGLDRRERDRLRRMLDRPMPRIRIGNAALLALMAAVELLNWLSLLRARWYRQYVRPGLEQLSWWQTFGVQPQIKALDDGVFGNVITTDPNVIKTLMENDDLDAFAVTALPPDDGTADEPGRWEAMAILMRSKVVNYLDWSHFIEESPAIRGDATGWSYRLSDIVETLTDFDVSEQWIRSDILTRIVASLREQVRENTTQDLYALRFAAASNPAATLQDPDYGRHDTFEAKPQATRIARFRSNLSDSERVLFTPDGAHQYYYFGGESLFFIFPNSEVT